MKLNYGVLPILAFCVGCASTPKSEQIPLDQRLMSDGDLAKVHSKYSREVPDHVYHSIQRKLENLPAATDIGEKLQNATSFNVIRGKLTPEMIDLLKGLGYSRLHVINVPFERGVQPIYILEPIKSK